MICVLGCVLCFCLVLSGGNLGFCMVDWDGIYVRC